MALALEKKCLTLGIVTGLLPAYEGTFNPYEVVVSESGASMWNKRIKFEIHRDFDVMAALLNALAQQAECFGSAGGMNTKVAIAIDC